MDYGPGGSGGVSDADSPAAANPASPLNAAEKKALRDALLDEYAAETYYTNVIEKLGASRRFENIRRAERRHAGALLNLFEKYGVEPPERPEATAIASPDTMQKAIELAVDLEIENGRLYEEQIKQIEHEDIRSVFERLRYVSLNHHLPAFRRGL